MPMPFDELEIRYKVVSEHYRETYEPRYASEGAAGMDLHACIPERWTLGPGERKRIPTGVAFEIPGKNVVGLVYARSGLAWRHGIGLPNGVGVIDSDYIGEIQVLLTNFGEASVSIEPGDRIAQIVFTPIYLARLKETDELRPTERGTAGFGSTGISLERQQS